MGTLLEGKNIRTYFFTDDGVVKAVDGISYDFQEPMTSLNPFLTIGRQVTEALELHMRMDRRSATTRAIELLEMVGIPDAPTRLKEYPHQRSGGMRQRGMR